MDRTETIFRNSGPDGNTSGRFYPPLGVFVEGRRVLVREDRALSGLAVWPDEAEALGLALIKAAVLARSVQEAAPRL